MSLSSKFKFLAVMSAVLGLAVFIAAPAAKADQNSAPGQQKIDPNGGNGNNGTPPGANNGHSQRDKNCKGRGCGPDVTPPPPPPPPPVDEVAADDNDGNIVLDCLDPQFKKDPRCVAPVTKKSKRKIVSVKLSSDDNIVPAAVEATPVAAVTPAPLAVVEPAAVVPAPIVKVKASAGAVQTFDLGATNFQ